MATFDALLDVLFPPSCVACDRVLGASGALCDECEPLTLSMPAIHCGHCGEPGRFANDRCPRCRQSPPEFSRAFAPFEHEGSVARAIHRFKYEDRPDLAGPLARWLAVTAHQFLIDSPVHVCPLPLHQQRYRQRGYDQATLLAGALARLTRRPLADGWLTRVRPTARQVGLTDAQREANVRGAFRASSGVRGHRVLLIDDVLTTGATACEATRSLLAAGASAVLVLTLARARRLSAHGDRAANGS